MRLFLLHFLKAVWHVRVAWFWPIWIALTGAATLIVAWLVSHTTSAPIPIAKPAADISTRRHYWTASAVAALSLLALFLVCYVGMTLKWEDFADYDESAFTLFALRGQNLSPPIWQDLGRFFPLGDQEFNLIRHFTHTVAGYHVFSVVQICILCCVLLALTDELSVTIRAALAAFALITPGVVYVFSGLYYPERNVVFWLACLALFVKYFERTKATAWAAAAAVSAQIMIYYKDTAFLLLAGFAASRLILRCRNAEHPGWDFRTLRSKESSLDWCLGLLGLIFCLYYLAAMFPHPNTQYATLVGYPLPEVVLFYLKTNSLMWLLALTVLFRTYLILRGRVQFSPLWDGLACGGSLYFAAYLYLGLCSFYYPAPVNLIAVLYLGRFAALAWERVPMGSKVAISVLALALLVQNVSLSAYRLFERKNTIHAKAEIARVVGERYSGSRANAQRAFFPFATPYVLMEFGSYLNYRGVPVEGATPQTSGPNTVVMVSSVVAMSGPCVAYRSLICQAGSGPERGDLVIVLPDDNASRAETTRYRERGQLLLAYEPRPRLPRWSYPLVSLFRAAWPSRNKEISDRWLDASVTVWK
ncbi:MAG: hypothetical protein ABSF46_11590 [Terriglobia bacterium]|jgi:hypothetical protein